MSDAESLLDLIEDAVVSQAGDLGGWTRRHDDVLQLFDGRVTLRAEIRDAGPAASEPSINVVHAHVTTTLHEHDDETLDACVMGMGQDAETALRQTAMVWVTGVAGPIKSFLDNTPVCMSCQAGVIGGDAAEGYSPHDFGLSGLRAFVGPVVVRSAHFEPDSIGDDHPWFRYAAEAAAPRRVHLVKATFFARDDGGWQRDLEVDGHDVSIRDSNWPVNTRSRGPGYVTRFAVFEFPRNSTEVARRDELERTIRRFAESYAQHDSIDALTSTMLADGFDQRLIDETESFATLAFGRLLFGPLGVNYSPTIVYARRDGSIDTDVALASLPAYTRGLAIAAQLRETMPREEFQALCCYSAESNAIINAMKADPKQRDLSAFSMHPPVVPERGASQQTMKMALEVVHDLMARQRRQAATPNQADEPSSDEPRKAGAEKPTPTPKQSAAPKKPWWKFW